MRSYSRHAKSKKRGFILKRIWHRLRYSRINAGLLIFLLMVGFLAISYPISKIMNKHKIEEKSAFIDEQAELIEQAEPEVFIFKEKENKYSFYDLLESRTFVVGDEELKGGVEYVESYRLPTLEPTEESIIKEDSLLEEQSGKIEFERRSVSVTKPVIPLAKRLQVGSFSSSHEANIHRKQLETYGYNVQIVRGVLTNEKIVFRVIIGPFALNELEGIKKELAEKSIDFFEVD